MLKLLFSLFAQPFSPRSRPTPRPAVECIHANGGKGLLAHLTQAIFHHAMMVDPFACFRNMPMQNGETIHQLGA